MTVSLAADGTIALDGACAIEDAERLQQYLLADPRAAVDWRTCSAAHAAVIQILLAGRPLLRGPPANDFLQQHVEPLINAAQVAASGTRQ